MLLGSRLHKVLDLGLRELTLPCEALARSDLIAEGFAHLRDPKRQLVRVLLEAELVVQEDALSGLRPEVPLDRARRPNRRGEHEVEGLRLREVVAGIWGLDGVLLEDLGELLLRVRVRLVPYHGVLLHLIRRNVLLLELRVHHILQQLVRAVELFLVARIPHQEVTEAVNVPRGLQNRVGHDVGVLDLHHLLLNDEVVPPLMNDVGLERAARRAIGVETADATVDLGALAEEEASPAEVLQLFPVPLEVRHGARGCG
mmetsp:Transcript_45288/g.117264  ORF Transcript_45288/g.117264 Transcript_45288/m.117264 type:complete len:257 (+) Transcript_45288:1319-2089(+)